MKKTFRFDTRLGEEDLELFTDFIGKSIGSIQISNARISTLPELCVENYGKCWIEFNRPGKRYASLELTSLFREIPIAIDCGGIAFRKIQETRIPLQTKAFLKIKSQSRNAAIISYPERSLVKSIKFYGHREVEDLKDDPGMDLEYLSRFGYKDFPIVELNTIEFMLIEHENLKRTLVTSKEGGFFYDFLESGPIDQGLQDSSYLKVNGYDKNIILQHEVP